VGFGVTTPGRYRLDVPGHHPKAVFVAQQVLEQDLDAVGEPGHVVARQAGAARRKISKERSPTARVERAEKESGWGAGS